MRILLASPNEPLASLIRKSLDRFNYTFTEVDNGLDVFQKAISVKYDLIILEYDLPRMMALEVLRRFGSIEQFNQPPVLVITNSEEEREQIEDEHFLRTEVVARPIAIRELVSRVEEILQHGPSDISNRVIERPTVGTFESFVWENDRVQLCPSCYQSAMQCKVADRRVTTPQRGVSF